MKPLISRVQLFSPLLAFGALLTLNPAQAGEGMWMPQQLPQLSRQLQAGGLQIDPARLTQLTEFPMGAIISLGGCTASFVSPLGLVVTNHHCAYGSIQYHSTPQRDLLKNGFLAATLADELPAEPGSRAFVTVAVDDVSAQVLDAATLGLRGKARGDAIEARQKALIAACEQDAGHRCSVPAFYGGLQYQLIKQLEIRDLRLVHAPAQGVGLFGGDTDNWMWPRHTGDYSFYRAYVGPDGKPADFNAANQPYQPRHFLKLASSPLKENDFVMVAGYPGSSNRHRLPVEVDFAFGWSHPARIKAMGEQLALIKAATAGRRDAEIAMADRVAGIANYFKNLQGQQESYDASDILARKQKTFAELKAWVAGDAQRTQQYGADIARAESLLAERHALTQAEFLLDYTSPRLLTVARTLYKQARQRALPDAQRQAGFQQRDERKLRQAMEVLSKRYDAVTDKQLAAHFLAQYLALPKSQLNAPLLAALGLQAGMDEAAIKTRLDALYAASELADTPARLAWLDRTLPPTAPAATALWPPLWPWPPTTKPARTAIKSWAGKSPRPAQTMKALIAYQASLGQAVYPDANSTLRVSFGAVEGRQPGTDGTNWTAFTTLRGIQAKHTGEGEFNAPAEQLAAIKARKFDKYAAPELDSVPVNFLSTLDTTGGNSGSPVLNGRAELVGLLFDGTLDAVIADWDFNPKTTRSICLDARYMLWQMTVVDKAERLLKEMGAL
ncbi:S46 family peptidase [Roseateles sp. GG27B]